MNRWLLGWVAVDGRVIDYKMPSKAHAELTGRLAWMVNENTFLEGLRVTAAQALAAYEFAKVMALIHSSTMRDFCVDRRAMSKEGTRVEAYLHYSPWTIRRCRLILEAARYFERVPTLLKWRTWADGISRRRATVFRFGRDFYGWLAYASREVRFMAKRAAKARAHIQDDNADNDIVGASSSDGSACHMGENRRGIVKLFAPSRAQSDAAAAP